MQEMLNKLIEENRVHQERWDELITFLTEGRDRARTNNAIEVEYAYVNTINKLVELFSK